MVNRMGSNFDASAYFTNPPKVSKPVKVSTPEVDDKKSKKRKRKARKRMDWARSFRGKPLKRFLYRIYKWFAK